MTTGNTQQDNYNKPIDNLDVILDGLELPIMAYRERIIDAVESNQATVITAETGAGKSTQVPQMLAEAGYEVIVTQPRVMAARTVAERVAEEADDSISVAYRTAKEKSGPADADITFCTDGLQVVRSLAGREDRVEREKVLVVDEVHEWNTNIEVLLAWAKKEQIKIVTMSATLESEALSQYFGNQTPVIEVPGRTFDVARREGGDLVDETVAMAQQGKNTLVFLPGKKEIDDVERDLRSRGVSVPIIPLHGQLSAEEQRKAFMKHGGGKIVLATNVAQTSITIEDIDAVVDSGLERRTEERKGVEGLFMAPISQADCLQRAGRAGRTKPGEYVLASLKNIGTAVAFEEREAHPTPEILRTRLDRTMLRLAASNFDMESMDFFHQPDRGDIAQAKLRLRTLGALTENQELTDIGRKMDRLPLETHLARMVVESHKYPKHVQSALVECIGIQQAGGIVKNGKYNVAWQRLTKEVDSDFLAQRDVLRALSSVDKKWSEYDILGKNVSSAKQSIREIRSRLGLRADGTQELTPEDREAVLKCIAAGLIDQVWVHHYAGSYDSALEDSNRELSSSSVCSSDILVATPFDLQINTKRGPKTLNLLQGASKVDPAWLPEIAPQLISLSDVGDIVFSEHGHAGDKHSLLFGNLVVGEEMLVPDFDKLQEHFANILLSANHPLRQQYLHWRQEINQLQAWARTFDPQFATDLQSRLDSVIISQLTENNITNLHTLLANAPRLNWDDIFNEDDITRTEALMREYPDVMMVMDEQVPINYVRSYDSTLEAQISLSWEQVVNGDVSVLPTNVALRLLVDMPDGAQRSYSRIEDVYSGVETIEAELHERQAERLKREYEQQLIESGDYLTNFGGRTRIGTGSGNQYFWVVNSAGELRQADRDGSDKIWDVIYPDEIALTFASSVRDPNVGSFEVASWPDQLTSEQVYAIRHIEQSHQFIEGAWQIGDEETERQEDELLEDVYNLDNELIEAAVDSVERPYLKLRSTTGLLMSYDQIMNSGYRDRLGSHSYVAAESGPQEYTADGREAYLLDEIRLDSERVIVLLSYEKYGNTNYALKLVDKPTPDDGLGEIPMAVDDLDLALSALESRFTKNHGNR
ncbi:hypothetical protein KC867_00055 [Candidatus Saccharibacteria bacterium]|nr:hypothetical protein [Candidatus Saccharibacteria bacterium]